MFSHHAIIMHAQLTLMWQTSTVSWVTLCVAASMIHIWFMLQRIITFCVLK